MALGEQRTASARNYQHCLTVLISPYVALAQRTITDAQARGLFVRKFETSAPVDTGFRAGVLVVSADVAVNQGFSTHLAKLHASGVLARVVFDEAHVLAIDAFEYRPTLLSMRYL